MNRFCDSTYSPGRCICDNVLARNPATYGMLGLCPMLAVSTSVTPALSLGLITTATMGIAALAASAGRNAVPESVRLPFFMLVISTTVIFAELLFARHFPGIRSQLGIFLPLVITNCAVLARLESVAYRSHAAHAIVDALSCGLGLTVAIVALAVVRSLLASGTVGMAESASGAWNVGLFLSPAGGFITFGLMAAAANAATGRLRRSEEDTSAPRS